MDYPTEERSAAWFAQFYNVLRERGGLGLTPAQTDALPADQAALAALESRDAASADPELLRERDEYIRWMKYGVDDATRTAFPAVFTPLAYAVAPGVKPRLYDFVGMLRTHPQYTPASGEDLDIANLSGDTMANEIPHGDNEFLGWYEKLLDTLPAHQADFGVSDAQLAERRLDKDVLAHLVRGVDGALNDGHATEHFKELRDYKNWIRDGASANLQTAFPALFGAGLAVAPGILPRLRGYVETVESGGLDEATKRRLGLLPLAAVGAATIAATRTAAPVERGRVVPPVPLAPARGGIGWVWPLLLTLGIGGLGWYLWPRGEASLSPNASASRPRSARSAPILLDTPSTQPGMAERAAKRPVEESSVILVPDRKPEDILILAEKGATNWLQNAATEFNKRPTEQGAGRILLASAGSREGRDQILYDKQKITPAAWVPADLYWVDKIKRDAGANLSGASGATVGDGKALLKTYLVLGMKSDRAAAFQKAAETGAYKGKTWTLLRDLAVKGWSVTGNPAWGRLKLAHTDPTLSNSGMSAMALIFNEFARLNPGKDMNAPGFKFMLTDIESAAGGTFYKTTSDAVAAFASGKADAVLAYESDIVRGADTLPDVAVVYPTPTARVVLPAAVVAAKWVSEAQAKRAEEFTQYLLQADVQEKALADGFRPANAALAPQEKTAMGEVRRKQQGMVIAPAFDGGDTDTKTKEGLIFLWNKQFGKR